jgi:hypothetical protein
MDGLKIKRTFQQEVNGGQLKEASLRKPAKPPAVFQGMRPISKPSLVIEIYTFWENSSTEEYRR